MLSVKKVGIKYNFWVFGKTWPEIEPRSPGPLANSSYFGGWGEPTPYARDTVKIFLSSPTEQSDTLSKAGESPWRSN